MTQEELAKLLLLIRDGDYLSRGLAANRFAQILVERDMRIAVLQARLRACEPAEVTP